MKFLNIYCIRKTETKMDKLTPRICCQCQSVFTREPYSAYARNFCCTACIKAYRFTLRKKREESTPTYYSSCDTGFGSGCC